MGAHEDRGGYVRLTRIVPASQSPVNSPSYVLCNFCHVFSKGSRPAGAHPHGAVSSAISKKKARKGSLANLEFSYADGDGLAADMCRWEVYQLRRLLREPYVLHSLCCGIQITLFRVWDRELLDFWSLLCAV